jgi:hypothetical protein
MWHGRPNRAGCAPHLNACLLLEFLFQKAEEVKKSVDFFDCYVALAADS